MNAARRVRAAVVIFCALTLLLACIPSIEDLTPFPCANDGTCPRGLSCTPTVGCVRAAIDSPCVAGQTDCAGAANGAVCELGLCTVACDERRPCAAGRTCSVPASAGEGVCALACTPESACPPGLSCRPLGYGDAMGCLGSTGRSSLGGPCARTTDCEGAGTAAMCLLGVCTTPCGPTRPCDPGRVCSGYRGDGGCLPECTGGERCAQGLECKALNFEGKKACIGSEAAVPSCSADMATDTANCGGCGRACASREVCQAGECKCLGDRCGDTCTDFQNDPRHCGSCGHDCGTGACVAGQCEIGEVGPWTGFIGADGSGTYRVAGDGAAPKRWLVERVSYTDRSRSVVVDHTEATATSHGSVILDASGLYTTFTSATNEVVLKAPLAGGSVETVFTQNLPLIDPHDTRSGLQLVAAGRLFSMSRIGTGNECGVFPNDPSLFDNRQVVLSTVDLATKAPEFFRTGQWFDCAYNPEQSAEGFFETWTRHFAWAERDGVLYEASGTSLRSHVLGRNGYPGCQICCGETFTSGSVLRSNIACTHDRFPGSAGMYTQSAFAQLAFEGSTLFMIRRGFVESMDVATPTPTVKLLTEAPRPVAMVLTPTHVVWLDYRTGSDAGIYRVAKSGGPAEKVKSVSMAEGAWGYASKTSLFWSLNDVLSMYTP